MLLGIADGDGEGEVERGEEGRKESCPMFLHYQGKKRVLMTLALLPQVERTTQGGDPYSSQNGPMVVQGA